jgi:serine/threonine-protein kinase HipA
MKCLICYKPLDNPKQEYHKKCLIKEFGIEDMPVIDIDEKKIKQIAKDLIGESVAITGVQPKLSLWLEKRKGTVRFTIVDNKSNFIIKPQSEVFESLPENEDLCMRMASEIGITTANHCLIKLPSGNLAYITQRFDRVKNSKLASEDFCQLTENLTEHKYRGSYEMIGKKIIEYSSQTGLDLLSLFELVLFSFITGNADMHLKNFSMFEDTGGYFKFSPAYDLVSTHLVIKNESEQMSLTLNGKKNKLKRKDFEQFAEKLNLSIKQTENSFQKFIGKKGKLLNLVDMSFIPKLHKEKFKELIIERIQLFT